MNERDLISTQTIKQVSEGGDKVRADLKATASAQDQLAASSTKLGEATEWSAKKQTSVAASFAALQRSIDPASRALAELENAQKKLGLAFDQNPARLSEINRILDVYAGKLDAASKAAENLRRQQAGQSMTPPRAQDAIDKSFGIGSTATPSSARASASAFFSEADIKANDHMTESVNKLRASMRPLEVEQGKLGQEMVYYRGLLKSGAITSDEFAEKQAQLGKRLSDVSQNLKMAGTAGRVMSGEMTNLGFQLNDVVTGLALGQSPFMILGQQGGQIVQIFANSKSSIADFAKSSVGWFSSLFTAGRVAFGGVAAAVGTAVFAMHDFAESQRAAGQALIGVGERTGTTTKQINEFAKANATATGLSVDQARDLAIEFTKTGNISIAGLKGLGDAVHGYSILTGKDAKEATTDLAQALGGDLTKAAEKLNMTYSFLDAKGRDYIRTLELQGGRTQAIQFIVDQMAKDNEKAAESLSFVAKAWDAVANAASRAKNAIGSANIKDAQLAGGLGGTEGMGLAAAGNQTMPASAIPDAERMGAVVKQMQEWAIAADNVTRATIPQIAQIEALEKAEVDLIAIRNARQFAGQPADQQQEAALTAIRNQITALSEAKDQSARYNREVAFIAQSWGNVGQSVALQLQAMQNVLPVAQAWTEATRMRAQQEATYLSLIQQGRTEEEASAVAAKQYELSKAAAVANAQRLVQSSNDNLDTIRAQGTSMEGVVASSIAYRDAIQGGATAMQANVIAANTLEASMIRAAQASQQMQQSQVDAANGTQNGIVTAASFGGPAPQKGTNVGSMFAPDVMTQSGAFTLSYDGGGASYKYGGGGKRLFADISRNLLYEKGIAGLDQQRDALAAQAAAMTASDIANNTLVGSGGSVASAINAAMASGRTDTYSTLQSLYGLLNSQTDDKNVQMVNDQQFLSWLQGQPQTVQNLQAIQSLTDEIQNLANSTDSLNETNKELLSPYYSQDPRTSHIGFRTQGMANEGSFIVPGGYSANDNTLVTMPLASGERVDVSRPERRGGGGVSSIHITNNNYIAGGANRDEFGRTAYQTAQTTAKVVRAAMQ